MNNSIVRPDFAALNGQALLDAYNGYVNKWRTSKFSSKADGVAACNKVFDEFAKKNDLTVIEHHIPDEFEQAQEDYDRAKQVEAEVIADLEAKANGKAAPASAPSLVTTEEESFNLNLISELHCSEALKVKFCKMLGLIKNEKASAPRKSKNNGKVIKIKALRNPRREGSKAWHHFEVMNRSDVKTVSDYLNSFPAEQRKNANQWLSNTIADGFVELVDAE
jgi:hypothetical protein